ncbi:MAG: serpin family protein [Lachnospiraceae bacterium]|nr:serpin family protein [Lachnospiraceae bacterium]
MNEEKNKRKKQIVRTAYTLLILAGSLCILGFFMAGRRGQMPQSETDRALRAAAVKLAEFPEEPIYKSDEERYENRKTVPEAFAAACQEFGVQTGSAVLKDAKSNIVYSPLGLYFSLAVAAEGAEGETRKELLNLLGYPYAENLSADAKEAFEAIYHVPNEKNNKKDEFGEYPAESRYCLRLATSLWADEDLGLKETFSGHAAQYFYADSFEGDLQTEKMQTLMADWVKDRTGGVLALPNTASGAEELLSLRNVVYFYDEWLDRFQVEATKTDSFMRRDGSEVSCEFMNRREESHAFRKGENFTSSRVSLKSGSVLFILPDEGVDVHELVKSPKALSAVLYEDGGKTTGEVIWKIPKFSYGSHVELSGILKDLGIKKAFSDADFSNISDVSPLFLSQITQNVHIGIDENGVEATAFTELSWAGAAMPVGRAEMILDRPFLYAVFHRGQVLFLGICEDPTQE